MSKLFGIILMALLLAMPGIAIENTAIAHADDGHGAEVSISANESVQLLPNPAIGLTVTAQPEAAHYGDLVNYTFTVTDTGQGGLQNITVTDSLLGSIKFPKNWLAPQESMVNITPKTFSNGGGIMATEILRPSADGYLSELGGEDFDEDLWEQPTPLYQHVDEVSTNYNDFLWNPNGPNKKWAFFELANPASLKSGDAINSVTVHAIYMIETAPPEDPLITSLGIYMDSTRYEGAASELSYESDPMNVSTAWTVNPKTGLAWTYNDIVALQAGVSSSESDYIRNAIVQFYVTVDYTASSSGNPHYAYAQQ